MKNTKKSGNIKSEYDDDNDNSDDYNDYKNKVNKKRVNNEFNYDDDDYNNKINKKFINNGINYNNDDYNNKINKEFINDEINDDGYDYNNKINKKFINDEINYNNDDDGDDNNNNNNNKEIINGEINDDNNYDDNNDVNNNINNDNNNSVKENPNKETGDDSNTSLNQKTQLMPLSYMPFGIYIIKKMRRVVIISFIINLGVQLIVFFRILNISKSEYSYSLIFPIILNTYTSFMASIESPLFLIEETLGPLSSIIKCDIFSCCTPSSNDKRRFTRWISYKVFICLYMFIIILIKPRIIYNDMFDPPTNSSSCNSYLFASVSDLELLIENPLTENDIYNSRGYFNKDVRYSDNSEHKFCVMDQTYSFPEHEDEGIIVYKTKSPGCSLTDNPTNSYCINNGNLKTNPKQYIEKNIDDPNEISMLSKVTIKNGTVAINGYFDSHKNCLNSFDTLSYGIEYDYTCGSSSWVMTYCPANSPSLFVCVPTPYIKNDNGDVIEKITNNPFKDIIYPNPDGNTCSNSNNNQKYFRLMNGSPKKICPYCLNTWRITNADEFGPPGYEHCDPYNSNLGIDYTCIFVCPGRGYGIFGPNESFEPNDIKLTYIYYISSIILYISDIFIVEILMKKVYIGYDQERVEKIKKSILLNKKP